MIPTPLLARFNDYVAAHLGLDFPDNRSRDLERGLWAAARELNFHDLQQLMRWLTETPPAQGPIQALARHLTVAETYFFRDAQIFLDALERHILPEIVAARDEGERRIRIWSAGCATGEEPYSIAILLDRLSARLEDWNVTVLGTDVNTRALKIAEQGVYRPWSFRGAPDWLQRDYFRVRDHDEFEILPKIKNVVTFAYHNLAEDNYPSLTNNTNAMDVILCCNVLMYMTQEMRRQVVERFYRSLLDGGWLIVGSAEAVPALYPQFEPITRGALLFRRPPLDIDAMARIARNTPQSAPAIPQPELQATIPSIPRPGIGIDRPGQNAYARAVGLYERGRYSEAAQLLEPLQDAKAHALRARIQANTGALQQALAACEKAIAIDATQAVFHHLHASILQEVGRKAESLEAYRRALYLAPDMVVSHVALASLLKRLGRVKEATRHFRIAAALLAPLPRDAPVPYGEGLTAGRLRQAIRLMSPEVEP